MGATFGLAALTERREAHGYGGVAAGWRSTHPFPKSYAHGIASFALADVGVDLGLASWQSASAVCGAGVVYEVIQGYVSRYDIAADCAGATLDALWHVLVRSPRRGTSHPAVFLVGVAAGLTAVKLTGVDRDPGGYRDSFTSVAQFNVGAMRAVSAFAVTRLGTHLGLPPWAAAATTCATGVLLEPHGPSHAVGLEGTCLGAGASVLWSALRHTR